MKLLESVKYEKYLENVINYWRFSDIRTMSNSDLDNYLHILVTLCGIRGIIYDYYDLANEFCNWILECDQDEIPGVLDFFTSCALENDLRCSVY